MTITELKAWLRGTKWIRNHFGGHNSPEEVMHRQELFRNMRREAQVDEGNFVYYVVTLGTNIRDARDGVPIIFGSLYSAECECRHRCAKKPISVAAYNHLYGRFMITDDYWKRTY